MKITIIPLLDSIKIVVEHFIELSGLSGGIVPVVRHVLLALLATLIAWLSGKICSTFIVPIVTKITSKTLSSWNNVFFNKRILNTVSNIIPAVVIWQLLPLVFYQYPFIENIVRRLTAVYIAVMASKIVLVLLKNLEELDTQTDSSMRQYAKSFLGVLRIVVLFITTIIMIAILFNKNPLSLIAGLGATSAILMLVFKDTIEGLVAGIKLNSNKMISKGDWIVVPSTTANGIVEEITLTTVKVKNFDNTTVTVSPTTLANGSFQNWRSMKDGPGRKVNRLIYFDFRSIKFVSDEQKQALKAAKICTDEQLTGNCINIALFRAYIEAYLLSKPEVCKETTVLVRQVEATQCGLPLEVVFFIKNSPEIHYEHTLADIMEWCYASTAHFGLTIYQQYPEQ
jgi:mechanosensitive ion channel family protein